MGENISSVGAGVNFYGIWDGTGMSYIYQTRIFDLTGSGLDG